MLIDNVWYDANLNFNYGNHKFTLLPNSDNTSIVKCKVCLESRMYLSLMGIETCTGLKSS